MFIKSALAIGLVLGFAAQVHAATIIFTAVADQTFRDDGSALSSSDNFLRNFGFSTVWRSSIEFDVSAISGGVGSVIVTDAVFTIASGLSVNNDTQEVYATAGNGTTEFSDVTGLGTFGGTADEHVFLRNNSVLLFLLTV